MMLHINDCCNEVRQYVHMLMNILPAWYVNLWSFNGDNEKERAKCKL